MFYKIKVEDHIRVPADSLGNDLKTAISNQIREKYAGFISKDMGIIVDVLFVESVGEGIVIPGDSGVYYNSKFDILAFELDNQELINGRIKDITDFGLFITMGPVEGMVHISQSMNDFVSFSKDKVLTGKETNRVLKVNDQVIAKAVAISFKDIANPKFGLTMRQFGLGKLEWIEDDLTKNKGSN